MTQKIAVIGGGGFYGQYLVRDLLAHTPAEITIIGRTPSAQLAGERVRVVACDMEQLAELQKATAGLDMIVHCAGPFQNLPLNPLKAAVANQAHYLDIAEDRQFAKLVQAAAPQVEAAGIMALNGLSVCPAMEAILAHWFTSIFSQVLSVRTFAAPDTRKHRGAAMFHTMLWGVGHRFLQPRRGQPAEVYGWSEPEWVEFPPPIGRRLTYLVLEMADLDLLPQAFGVQTVEFKAGTEHSWLNRMLGWSATVRYQTGYPRWEQFTPLVRGLSWLAGVIGKDEGGVFFEVQGLKEGELQTYKIAVMADGDGGAIPILPAGIAAEEILTGRLATFGVIPAYQWIAPEKFMQALRQRGMTLWWQTPENPSWVRMTFAEGKDED